MNKRILRLWQIIRSQLFIQYICSDSASIHFIDCFDIVTAIQSHHYMHKEERRKATEWKTEEEAKAHNARCGVNYFPLTVSQHLQLLKEVEFRKIHVFWYSYMQMGIYE